MQAGLIAAPPRGKGSPMSLYPTVVQHVELGEANCDFIDNQFDFPLMDGP